MEHLSHSNDHKLKVAERSKAAWIALLVTSFLTAIKCWAAYVTSSVSVLSEGVHSGLDLASALVAFFTIRVAIEPADKDHPYGHGKIETLSSFFEALLLVGASIYIFYEAYESYKHPVKMEKGSFALMVIGLSLVLSFFAYIQNTKAAQKSGSSAIAVNAFHFLADTVTCVGVIISIILTELTQLTWIDPLIAAFIGVYIIIVSGGQILNAISELIDEALPDEEIKKIEGILNQFKPRCIEAHDLRTRKSGVNRHIEFHLTLCGKMSVIDSHKCCDEMEIALMQEFKDTQVHIHVEPCGNHDNQIPIACPIDKGTLCEYREKCRVV